ncbi:MAG: DUF1570 domain-containing protein [Planctomycetes bacterium]|nr:DUF1570 domain-containing protein [Planctomycetota bacterium]
MHVHRCWLVSSCWLVSWLATVVAVNVAGPANLATAAEPGKSSKSASGGLPAPADVVSSRAAPTADPAARYEHALPGQSVLVRVPDDAPAGASAGSDGLTVGRVHVTASDGYYVIVPSGQMFPYTFKEATPTDRTFAPASKDQLARSLTNMGPLQGFKTKQTKRFLYVYNSSDTFYAGTSRILETMYPGLLAYCKTLKLNCHEADLPLVVIMFRHQEDFDRFRKMPDGVVAYYDGLTNYVVMYEMSKLSEMLPDIALKQAVSTVAHEGVHQILQNIGVQQRLSRWPMWISEGLAEFSAPTDIPAKVNDIKWKGIGKVNDLRMSELKRYALARGGFDSATIRDTATAPQLTSTGYASAWALTHFLAQKRSDEFQSFMQEVSQRPPLKRFDKEEDEELFNRHFGKDYGRMSDNLFTHLTKLPFRDPLAEARVIVVPSKSSTKRGK